MERQERMWGVTPGGLDLLRQLVSQELDRRVAAIDDIVVAQYQVQPNRHTEEAIAALKVAVMALVRSPLADMERKLGVCEAEPAAEPVSDVEAEAEVEAKVKPEPEPERSKSRK